MAPSPSLSDARITSTFIFASNGNVRNLKAPWAVVGGDQDTTFNWTAISTTVTGSTQPAFGAALAGIDHNRVAGQPKGQEAYIGWMRWRFMGDKAGHDMFVGSACKICTRHRFLRRAQDADVRFALGSLRVTASPAR